jgi:hypothetical protein
LERQPRGARGVLGRRVLRLRDGRAAASRLRYPASPTTKVQHIIAFATLAALGSFAYPRIALTRLLVGLSVFGAFIEIVQTVPGAAA